MLIRISSEVPAAVSLRSARFSLFGTDKTVFGIDESVLFSPESGSGEAIVLINFVPISASLRMPMCAELSIGAENGAASLSVRGVSGELSVTDWSGEDVTHERVFEIAADYPLYVPHSEPRTADSIEFEIGGAEKARAELFCDDGVRLCVHGEDGESCYYISRGDGGALRVLDVGSERMLVVRVVGFHESFGAGLCAAAREKLVVLNSEFMLVGSVVGSSCFIEDGFLCVIDELDTVLAHQRRLVFEPNADGLRRCADLDEIGEIGFFTHPPRRPAGEGEAALALMECVLLGREAEAMGLLSPGLGQGLDFAGLCEFFGDFDEARRAPFESENGPPIVGAVKDGKAKSYAFEFENGQICDISELEPPFWPRLKADVTAEAE